jgi:UDP-N-acetylglucosamine acyltransferase
MYSGIKHIPQGINSEGLKRRGFTSDMISNIKRAYRTIYRSGDSFEEASAKIEEMAKTASELEIVRDFLKTATRGLAR